MLAGRLRFTHGQFVLLASIAWLTREDGKLSQIMLANQASMDPATTSQILRTLEKKNLLKRYALNEDQRAKYLYLTESGSEAVELLLPLVESIDRKFFACLGERVKDFNQLLRLLYTRD